MYYKKVLLVIFTILKLTTSSQICAEVTHTECGDDIFHLLDEIDTLNHESCKMVCAAFGEYCTFSLFDKVPFGRGNCRLYGGPFSSFILQCNELAGPRDLLDDCDVENPLDNTCQIYRSGNCNFGNVEETDYFSSWETCYFFCRSITQCQHWRFEKEQGLCQIMYSRESSCKWEFSPREPTFDECDDLTSTISPTILSTTTIPPTTSSTTTVPPTTSSTTTVPPTTSSTTTVPPTTPSTTRSSTCEVPKPQEHGYWFCLQSSDPFSLTCHLECDPGFVSDSYTVNTCNHGWWSSNPICVEAIALIAGKHDLLTSMSVEIYSEGLHKKLPNLPDLRYYHSLDLVNSVVLLCGGLVPLTDKKCLTLTSSQEWIQHSKTTGSRYEHFSVSILGKLHLMGSESSSYGDTTEYLEPPTSNQWQRGWDLHHRNFFACAVKIQPEIVLTIGGYYSDVVSYNVTNGKATQLQDLIKKRMEHGCVYVKEPISGMGRVLVAGGNTGAWSHKKLSSSEMYDMETGKWSSTGQLTVTRDGVRMLVVGTNILAFGGEDEHSHVLSSVDRFNLTTMRWTAGENMLETRDHHEVTGVPMSAVGIDKN